LLELDLARVLAREFGQPAIVEIFSEGSVILRQAHVPGMSEEAVKLWRSK